MFDALLFVGLVLALVVIPGLVRVVCWTKEHAG